MTSKEMDELLADIISTYTSTFGKSLTKKVARKLAASGIENQIQNINGDAYALAQAALGKCGTILEENSSDKIISGVILAGIANMNPAFIVLWVRDNTILIKASAKEGLIKQHTAEQAVKIFEAALDA